MGTTRQPSRCSIAKLLAELGKSMPNAAFNEQDRLELLRLVYGYRASALMYVADSLGIADALGGGARTTEDLAAENGTHGPALLRVLRGLTVLGVLDETEPGRFALTEQGGLMRDGVSGSVKGVALFNSGGGAMQTWGELLHTVKTGETTFDHVRGMTSFEFFAQNPEINAGFNAAMARGTRVSAPGIIAACDFLRFGTVVDVGGGNGTLLAAILTAHEGLRGIVQDSAAGAEDAPRMLEKAGVADRCAIDVRDFFESASQGGDAYILKHIIHDWNDEQSTTILRNIRQVVKADGRLLLIEAVLPAKVDTSDPAWMAVMGDLNMLVNTGGRERTEDEFRDLLAASGFRLERVIPAEAPWPLYVLESVAA
jgi:orsellinic acid C2-O-methyltransferase